MKNSEIAKRLSRLIDELDNLATDVMYTNHVKNERLNALLQGNLETASTMIRRTVAYLPED